MELYDILREHIPVVRIASYSLRLTASAIYARLNHARDRRSSYGICRYREMLADLGIHDERLDGHRDQTIAQWYAALDAREGTP